DAKDYSEDSSWSPPFSPLPPCTPECQLDNGFGPVAINTVATKECPAQIPGQPTQLIKRQCGPTGLWSPVADYSQCECQLDDGFGPAGVNTVATKDCPAQIPGKPTQLIKRQCGPTGLWISGTKDYSQCECQLDNGFGPSGINTVATKECPAQIPGRPTQLIKRQCGPTGLWSPVEDYSECECQLDDGFGPVGINTVATKNCPAQIPGRPPQLITRQCGPTGLWTTNTKDYSQCRELTLAYLLCCAHPICAQLTTASVLSLLTLKPPKIVRRRSPGNRHKSSLGSAGQQVFG
ncbi:hypothetical protein BDK51DRAFT_48917, partial [Blyttiomyces helicus]